MRALPEAMSTVLASGVTTFCNGWRITRRDGLVQGFTDHDNDIVADGTLFRAASGIAGSESTLAQGLGVTGMELSGALSDDALSEDDLAAGLYDGATIDLLLIDWMSPASCVLLRRGTLGEVRRQGLAFTVELRSLADALNQVRGRVYSALCDADLGDARCGVDLAQAAFHAVGIIVAREEGARLRVSGPAHSAGWFTGGRITVTSGALAGFAGEVKTHVWDASGVVLDLWQEMPAGIGAGDAFAVTAGCDKRFSTCRERFANGVNFRGCPHMPGNDLVLAMGVPGEGGNDGSVVS
ncbi:hypothetical protein GCM10007301_10860 [Azorhizobium oxalatiphilum]|uniref:Bacteriophage phiJL001 Gp84 C-terminal domain-containing protein n=1 Tax=Azorhizobium oxalatiphilum TaxID=980631 RepID=A0A917BQI9_9HYPH|nr:DUF2163 domain-containing protein [Azorhizobium oxalatiphilum]GGF53224.1 hypothetical protein GCM10007301_10860 [Azorhizobium oxalatiphilum]